jgi:hypothetical protein
MRRAGAGEVLAESCDFSGQVPGKLSVPSPNAHLKVPALVAGS